MLRVISCLRESHDPWLVAVAAGLCILATVTTIELLHNARKATRGKRAFWLAVAAFGGGSGVWATHFLAMLAFEPHLPVGYDVIFTALSLVLAIALMGLGLTTALSRAIPLAPLVGGTILGVGIAAMHFTGMAAYEVPGHVSWNPLLVMASVLTGIVLSAAGVHCALSGPGFDRRLGGALAILLGICALHFIAMGAVTLIADPRIVVPENALPAGRLAESVTLAGSSILLLAGAALVLDIRARRAAELERERIALQSFADAAVEGLLICRGERIVGANDSFGALIDRDPSGLFGLSLVEVLPDAARRLAERGEPTVEAIVFETELSLATGATVPVEVVMRPLAYGRQPHRAVAVRDLRARRMAENEIRFLAHHDALTGLANRASFARRLEQDLRHPEAARRAFAVLSLDLDGFKQINDLFGHAAGDMLLRTVARRVSGLLDETQFMARLGGDEFAILTPCDHQGAVGELAKRIQEALMQARIESLPAITASFGIALYPDDATDPMQLLNCADTALYRAKAEGRGTHRFFEASMNALVRERRLMEHDLHQAVAHGEMRLVYQPQHQLATRALIGFEVLLRWQHPVRGAVSPADFIPIAEECGAILTIGAWVLSQACREAAGWTNPLSIAVNVSAVQILAPHFIQSVDDILRETGLAPERLEIEITETALIRDPERAASTLRDLKALGVRLAMDDFGTGYSSLSNLRSYPFDKIKIDRSFIQAVDSNSQAAAIVRSVLGLGRGLGLQVLAEGVETEGELRFLHGERCHAAQGFLMGRPAPIETFAAHLHPSEAQTAVSSRAA